jgi:hypothetical protein
MERETAWHIRPRRSDSDRHAAALLRLCAGTDLTDQEFVAAVAAGFRQMRRRRFLCRQLTYPLLLDELHGFKGAFF